MGDFKLNIAITGEAGSGKSTFVNCLRGLMDNDIGAAKTGVVETTTLPTPYSHPKYPNITLWDLPGIGTPTFQTQMYCEKVNFKMYDFFIIVTSERFKCNHAMLAQKIETMGKKFYFIRAKVDVDLHSSKRRRNLSYNEDKILQIIKENAREGLAAEGVESSQVFLICNFELGKYDFPRLLETLERDISCHILQACKRSKRKGCYLC